MIKGSYGKTWLPNLIIGPLIFLLFIHRAWLFNNSIKLFSISVSPFENSYYVYQWGFFACVTVLLLVVHKYLFCKNIKIIGDFKFKYLLIGIISLSIGLAVITLIELLLKQPIEPSMKGVNLFSLPISIVLSLLLLVPIYEEIFFRHFILATLPFKINKWLTVLVISITSLLFCIVHKQYIYLTTYLWLFFVSIVYCLVRINSNGLLLPILLHSYTIFLVLLLSYFLY